MRLWGFREVQVTDGQKTWSYPVSVGLSKWFRLECVLKRGNEHFKADYGRFGFRILNVKDRGQYGKFVGVSFHRHWGKFWRLGKLA